MNDSSEESVKSREPRERPDYYRPGLADMLVDALPEVLRPVVLIVFGAAFCFGLICGLAVTEENLLAIVLFVGGVVFYQARVAFSSILMAIRIFANNVGVMALLVGAGFLHASLLIFFLILQGFAIGVGTATTFRYSGLGIMMVLIVCETPAVLIASSLGFHVWEWKRGKTDIDWDFLRIMRWYLLFAGILLVIGALVEGSFLASR
jgi:uncharacterized membrane protein SpoIIM required for sporulation